MIPLRLLADAILHASSTNFSCGQSVGVGGAGADVGGRVLPMSSQELALGSSWSAVDRDVARRLGAAVDGDVLQRPPLLAGRLSESADRGRFSPLPERFSVVHSLWQRRISHRRLKTLHSRSVVRLSVH